MDGDGQVGSQGRQLVGRAVGSFQSNVLAETNKAVCRLIGRLRRRDGGAVGLSRLFEKQKEKTMTDRSPGKKRPWEFITVLLIFPIKPTAPV